jgi:phospho-N-acetylmuramoyl-pentapeptide-transferase
VIAILSGGVVALVLTLVGTRWLISYLTRHSFGQFIREDGPKTHNTKRGTPTMGGVMIILVVVLVYIGVHVVTYFAWDHYLPSVSGMLVVGVLVCTGFLGFLDDWSKISNQRSLGLSPHAKLIGQILIGVVFSVLALRFPDGHGITPASQAVSFTRDINWLRLPLILAIIWMTFLITAASNAVNLTDGLDGLASGASTMVFAAFSLINIWQRNQSCEYASSAGPLCYNVRDPFDLSIISVALAASCFAFLWWNSRPAKIFLGDTGSLGLGAAMGALAICTRTELLFIILGGLFVIETLSVMIQVSYFKISGGKRVFKMAPLHHHFELLGWAEETVVVRFWIICGILAATAFGLFYADWVLTI